MARTVLVVDDDQDVLEVVAAMLEDLGCNVPTAGKLRITAEEVIFAVAPLLAELCRC